MNKSLAVRRQGSLARRERRGSVSSFRSNLVDMRAREWRHAQKTVAAAATAAAAAAAAAASRAGAGSQCMTA